MEGVLGVFAELPEGKCVWHLFFIARACLCTLGYSFLLLAVELIRWQNRWQHMSILIYEDISLKDAGSIL